MKIKVQLERRGSEEVPGEHKALHHLRCAPPGKFKPAMFLSDPHPQNVCLSNPASQELCSSDNLWSLFQL